MDLALYVPENMARNYTMNDKTSPDINAQITSLPFELALKELETIVAKLERGEVGLEESISIYERGEALKLHCEMLLKKAELRIEKVIVGSDGKAKGVEPLDVG